MKLYYSPGACSLSPHIALREAGVDFELEKVDLATKRSATGTRLTDVSPKGQVPVLVLDDGEVLTEGAAIVQYIADRRPEAGLAPPAGTLARVRVQEALNFVAAELHKSFSPLFDASAGEETKAAARARVERALGQIETQLGDGRPFLAGETFSVADGYLFVIASWAAPMQIPLDAYPLLQTLVERVRKRPAVEAALRAEGLL